MDHSDLDLNIHIHTSSDRQIRVAVIPSYPTIQTTLQQRRTHYPATHKAHRRRTVLGEAGFMCFGGSGLLGLDLGGAEGVFRRSGVEVVEEKCRWRGEGKREEGRMKEGIRRNLQFLHQATCSRENYTTYHTMQITPHQQKHILCVYIHTLTSTPQHPPTPPIPSAFPHPIPHPSHAPPRR